MKHPTSSSFDQKRTDQTPTTAEQHFLEKGDRSFRYGREKISSIEVANAIELGKLTALRFIEWLCEHPDGIVALPTGKSPEFFITFLKHFKTHWHRPDIQEELQHYGITQADFPTTSDLKFVQLDEFFPIDPTHRNSFYNFVQQYYLPLLEIKKENALLINTAEITDVDQFCKAYEEKINAWGGIGFFLGGIGPDGHVAFNVAGSAPNSVTRVVTLNYPSACSAASSLGGMDYARNKTAITIGLDTIIRKKDAIIIIIAAGQGKAPMVAHAIEQDDMEYPAAVLQKHPGTRFYLTHGAASQLQERYLNSLKDDSQLLNNNAALDRILTQVSLTTNKPLLELTENDLEQTEDGIILARKNSTLSELAQATHQRYVEKITPTGPHNRSLMHTAPHHDDVMLSYHPTAVASLADNHTHVAYATSGFTAVTNDYLMEITTEMDHAFILKHADVIFDQNYDALLKKFTHAYEKKDVDGMQRIEQLIVAHHIVTIYHCGTVEMLAERISWIQNSYIPSIPPGEKDSPKIQQLKGTIRETEVDRMWAIHGINTTHITHLRSKFYTGDYFTPRPTFADDVSPVLDLLYKHNPDIVTVAFDPEGTGPDTHYKVLQVVANAVRAWKKTPEIWGYRNVWHRFNSYDATLITPVSKSELDYLHTVFMACFSTQKDAAFPSHLHDGPFSELSVAIQKEQLQTMKTLLGADFFENHPDERMRNAAGLCFIKRMSTDEFLAACDTLREYTECVPT